MKAINQLKSWLTVDLGIDMGTTRTKICQKGAGVVLNEPSFIAVSVRDGEPLTAGKDAHKIFGRCPPHVEALTPINHGIIQNFDLAEVMLSKFMDQVFRRKALLGARIVMVVPAGVTDVEKKAFEDIAVQVGGREVYLVEAPIAATVGMGAPFRQAGALVTFYLGGGTTQAVIFSGGQALSTYYDPVGGESLTEAIIAGVKKNHRMLIGMHTAEQLKLAMGSAYPMDKEDVKEIYGKSMEDGLPRAVKVTSDEIREMMKGPLDQIVNTVKAVFERVPPELVQDIRRAGIYVCGGNSQVRGLPKLIERITGLRCVTPRSGQLTCIAGAESIISNPGRFKEFTVSSHSRQFTG